MHRLRSTQQRAPRSSAMARGEVSASMCCVDSRSWLTVASRRSQSNGLMVRFTCPKIDESHYRARADCVGALDEGDTPCRCVTVARQCPVGPLQCTTHVALGV